MIGMKEPSFMGLGDRLIAAGLVTQSQMELAMREQRRKGLPLSKVLVELGFVTAEKLSNFFAAESQTKYVEINRLTIEKSVLELLPSDLCRKFRLLPISRTPTSITVAMADPLNVLAIDTVRQITGLHVDVATATEQDILNFLDQSQQGVNAQEKIQQSIDEAITEHAKDHPDEIEVDMGKVTEEDAPIIRLVSQVIARAVNLGASDIHFEPEDKMMRIRMRIDGVMHQDVLIPKTMQHAVSARLKIMADMDVAECRLPQDGRATVFVGRKDVSLRVSSLPTCYGENVVLRILSSAASSLTIANLGMDPDAEAQLRAAVDRPYGVIIVTGPTGSGKSTTLYAILRELATGEYTIFTLEDPIEYRMSGIRQSQMREDIGLTFSAGLRTLLRQDPDIILVGETRDTETATLMVRAALTGHMVFTTLHTNDAPGALPRLLDMGVEPFLLPDSLLAVLAQRLVRRLCNCKEPVPDPATAFKLLKINPRPDQALELWHHKGCVACKGSGFKGRQGVFELMVITPQFHDAIVHRAGAHEFAHLAVASGMKTMFDDGVRLATKGVTTIEEVLRVTKVA
jgi:type IV pilus assembly protein PilB